MSKKKKNKSFGFTLIEVLVAIAVASILLSGTIALIIYSYKVGLIGEHKLQAVSLAQEAMEATINIKDNDWSSFAALATGLNYYPIHSGTPEVWSLVQDDDGEDIGIFNRKILINDVWRYNPGHPQEGEIAPSGDPNASIDPDSREIIATVVWEERGGSKETVLSTYLTNWKVCIVNWPYTYGSNYTYDSNKIEVIGGMAQLIDRSAQEITNGNFETGDFTGWTEESGTIWDITNVDPGEGIYSATTASDSSALGILRSDNFISAGQQIRFQIKGFGSPNNRVALYRASDNSQLLSQNAPDDSVWQDVIWDLSAYPEQEVYIRVIDNSDDVVNGWMAVDYFRQTDNNGNLIEGYATDNPSIAPVSAESVAAVDKWYSFSEAATKNGGEIYYQLSNNGGTNWLYWDGTSWSLASDSDYNTADVVNANLEFFPLDGDSISVRAFLSSDGTQQVQLDNVRIVYEGS